ncbi:MAG: hypothetical protein NT004_10590 [Bacteroidetes bacterium]|nr:hypothetical protein [Bacteroidota bacterium]
MPDTEGIIQGEWKSANNLIELCFRIVFQKDNSYINIVQPSI